MATIVAAACGKLRGVIQKSSQGENYYAFKGIPYAQPPVGPLRFQDPAPLEPWTEIRDATSFGPISAQYDEITNVVKGSEDCLYLNVYTKCLDTCNLSPVMVWIHGGAFIKGSGDDNLFGPDLLLRKNVVLVTINYRLGIFGFLNLDDEAAPGNQGLKDQVMALKWVKNHISKFGGDANNVTIFGGSAGATSVHYLSLSPLAKDLFQKAICQSGSALNPWIESDVPRKGMQIFLNLLNFHDKDPRAIVKYLKTVDYKKLIETQEKLMTPQAWCQAALPFVPGVDDKSSNPFLSIPVSEAAKSGIQVPLIMGFNSNEGIFLETYFKQIDIFDLNNNFEKYTPSKTSEILQRYSLTLEDLKKTYFGHDKISNENLHVFINMWGDLLLKEGILNTLTLQSKINKATSTFLYKFSYDKNVTPYKSADTKFKGVSHGEESAYLFNIKLFESLKLKQFQSHTANRIMTQMVELWTEFARTGKPTLNTSESTPVVWQPIGNEENFNCLNIDVKIKMECITNIQKLFVKNCE